MSEIAGVVVSHIIRPAHEQLDNWLGSDVPLLLRAECIHYSLRTILPQADHASVVSISGSASAPKWKQAAATWFDVYPTLVAVNVSMVHPLADSVNWPVLLTGSSMVLTVILTWVILPHVQRALRPWMFAELDKDSR